MCVPRVILRTGTHGVRETWILPEAEGEVSLERVREAASKVARSASMGEAGAWRAGCNDEGVQHA